MINQILYLSTEYRNELPFGSDVNVKGSFGVMLKNELNKIEKQKKVRFVVSKKEQWKDNLYCISQGKKIKIGVIDGYSSVSSITSAIAKKIGK
jgi:hypothetical protein